MGFFDLLAERRMAEAVRRGELDNLPGSGKPLPPDEFANLPDEIRMACRVLRNANVVPEEMQLDKELRRLRDLFEASSDDEERERLRSELRKARLRLDLLLERSRGPIPPQYLDRVRDRLK